MKYLGNVNYQNDKCNTNNVYQLYNTYQKYKNKVIKL